MPLYQCEHWSNHPNGSLWQTPRSRRSSHHVRQTTHRYSYKISGTRNRWVEVKLDRSPQGLGRENVMASPQVKGGPEFLPIPGRHGAGPTNQATSSIIGCVPASRLTEAFLSAARGNAQRHPPADGYVRQTNRYKLVTNMRVLAC